MCVPTIKIPLKCQILAIVMKHATQHPTRNYVQTELTPFTPPSHVLFDSNRIYLSFAYRWSPSLRMADGGQLSDFIDGLGPGQLVGRQVLGAPALGDIQLSLCHQKGCLEVEVIRARGLQVFKFTLLAVLIGY